MSISELTPPSTDKQQHEERFRYVDLSHPLIQMLFNLALDEASEEKAVG